MFTKPTVFILGAGASWHYGFPTGEDLVRQVILKAKQLAKYFGEGGKYRSGGIPSYARRNHIGKELSVDMWRDASRESIELCNRLSRANPTLIDYFLAQNPDLQDIGRFAIALVIFECEHKFVTSGGNPNHQLLFDRAVCQGKATNVRGGITASAFSDDWLRFVQYKLTSGCKHSEDLLRNNVRFVTFNYDNSLETRLHMGLSSISHFKPSDVYEFLGKDRVLHIYGAIRERVDSSWQPLDPTICTEPETQPFKESNERLDTVFAASTGIRTIDGDDKVRNTEVISAASKAIEEAEVAYILGFGFDASNVERLNLHKLAPHGARPRTVFLTNFGGQNRVSIAAGRALMGIPKVFLNAPVIEQVAYYNEVETQYRYEMSTKNVYDAFAEDFDSLEV